MFNLDQWRTRLAELLADFRQHPRQAAGETLFWTLVTLTLLPLAPALTENPFAVGAALAGIVGGGGANLLADLIGRLRTTPPDEQADLLAEALASSADLRGTVDTLLAELDVLGEASAGLSAADRRWFTQALRANLAAFPDDFGQARQTIDRIIHTGGGDYVEGDKVGGDKVAGDKVFIDASRRDDHSVHIQAGGDVHMRTADSGQQPDPAPLRRAYLGHVAAVCNTLPLSAIDPRAGERTRERSMTLAAVYTALDTTTLVPVEPDGEKQPRDRQTTAELVRADIERGETRPLSVLEATVRDRRMVLLGGPGSGKSTFGRWLALCLARANLDPAAGWLERLGVAWSHGLLLPIRVVLRDFAASVHCDGTVEGLWQFIAATLAADGLGDYAPILRDELLAGGVLVTLDGLDEVADPVRRRAVRDAVQAFAGVYGHVRNRFLVSCRPYAYAEPAGQLADFPTHTLAPFSQEAIDAFVAAWYASVQALRWKTEAEARELITRLQAATRRLDLAPLASNPLQLTMMASLHTSWGRLPDDRAVLYDQMVELLLVRWQEARLGEDTGVSQVVNPAELRRALECAACDAHRSQAQVKGTADIRELDLVDALRDCAGGSLDEAAALTAYIRQRAGLLVEREPGVYTFPHRSYQEYLAGCHLAVQPDFPDQAAALARENLAQWREAVLWAVAVMARVKGMTHVAVDVVNALCPRDIESHHCVVTPDWRQAALAGEALLEIGVGRLENTRHEGVLERVRSWLAALLEGGHLEPRERTAAGDVLGWLGDPRNLDELVAVPEGSFVMGEEKSRHETTLPTFRIGRYPVTNQQYARFIEAGGYNERRYWTEAGWQWRQSEHKRWGREHGDRPKWWDDPERSRSTRPVVGVSWFEVVAYCRWLTEFWRGAGRIGSREEVRLATEAQWEKAARGTDGRKYPWGQDFDPDKANTRETGLGHAAAVGCFPGGASPCGALDLAGNVWEWCQSLYRDYPYRADDGREDLETEGTRVLRGGSFNVSAGYARCACRDGSTAGNYDTDNGFRVVVVVPSDSPS